MKLDGYYIEGYWQCELYFSDIREKILETYRFPDFDKSQRRWIESIQSTCSVSVHIRRGDYLKYPYLQNICTLDYYKKAMQYFRDKFQNNVMFYIFTNDFPWAEQYFTEKDCCFVKGNIGKDSFRDMQLMSLCRHHIIANSSFSWWGAWLNQNPDKMVIAPKKWVNNTPENEIDIIPDNWLKIDN